MAYILAGLARYQEDIKKSRFLALASPVSTPEQALQFFQRNSAADATHNCWAYKLGSRYRFNDDGEPGGTAGRPILQAIEGQHCDNVAVLVIRWFGGIKLGTGGLVRAYAGTAAQCLRQAEKHELVVQARVRCFCSFADMAIVQSRLAMFDACIEQERFDSNGVHWVLCVAQTQLAALAQVFTDLTRGQGQWHCLQE
jgi:uncharacterized YigZ family protein